MPDSLSTTCFVGASGRVRLTAVNSPELDMRVSADDDHAKNSHRCQARYDILAPANAALKSISVMSTIADWGRSLSMAGGLTVSGIVVGMVKEGDSMVLLFVSDLQSPVAKTFDMRGLLKSHLKPTCIASLSIAGTTTGGRLVLSSLRPAACGQNRWILDPKMASGGLRRLNASSSIEPLH